MLEHNPHPWRIHEHLRTSGWHRNSSDSNWRGRNRNTWNEFQTPQQISFHLASSFHWKISLGLSHDYEVVKIHLLCSCPPFIFLPSFSGSLRCSLWILLPLMFLPDLALRDLLTKVSYLAFRKEKTGFMIELNCSWHTQLPTYNTLPARSSLPPSPYSLHTK